MNVIARTCRAANCMSQVSMPTRSLMAAAQSYEHIRIHSPADRVALVTLDRPKLNALNSLLVKELTDCLKTCDADSEVSSIVITGNDKAFAAGADIKEMKDLSNSQALKNQFIAHWNDISRIRKPVLAAVNGYALGGGCELAMMADVIYAGDNAQFGQPEIKLGTMPGAGGTQRLIRALGKSRAMHYILTGRMFTAKQAHEWGLVAEVFPQDELVPQVVKIATEIASYSQLAAGACKEAVNAAENLALDLGILHERNLFYALFGTHDQREGMAAFVEKRKPLFRDA